MRISPKSCLPKKNGEEPMEPTHVAELTTILCEVLNWNKSRCQCLAYFVLGILTVCTVSLPKIATTFSSKILLASRQKRLQRFVAWLANREGFQKAFGKLILGKLTGRKLILSIDRTNWKFGKSNINFVVLGVWFQGVSIPIYWINLGFEGNSSTPLRIEVFNEIIDILPVSRIKYLLADREFIGKEWFQYLKKSKIPFVIRIKSNIWFEVMRGKYRKTQKVEDFFVDLKQGKTKTLKRCKVYESPLSLAACLSSEGDLVVVATNMNPRFAMKTYKMRWSIETLFSCLKGRGFNFEDSHITDPKRGEALFFVLNLAFYWTMRVGSNSVKRIPLKRASHGRARKSIFRRGLDLIRECVIQLYAVPEKILRYISMLGKNLCKA